MTLNPVMNTFADIVLQNFKEIMNVEVKSVDFMIALDSSFQDRTYHRVKDWLLKNYGVDITKEENVSFIYYLDKKLKDLKN